MVRVIVLLAIMNQIKWMSLYDPIILAIKGNIRCLEESREI